MKPKGLKETTIAMCIMNISGLVFIDEKMDSLDSIYMVFASVVLATYFVLWFYWKGKNWARMAVMLTGILAIANLLTLPSINNLANSLIIIESVFGAFMLWWLNTSEVRNYFRRSEQ